MRLAPALLLLQLTALTYAQTPTGEVDGRGLSFPPDLTFQGSKLDDWQKAGDAEWQATGGEIVATVKPGGSGGYLARTQSYQDVALRALFKTTPGSEAGFLFRLEKTETGTKGVLVSIKDGEIASHAVAFDAQGQETRRDPLRSAGRIVRLAPPATANAPLARSGGSPGNRPRPASNLPLQRPDTSFRATDWNQIEIFLDLNTIRPFLNDGGETAAGAAEETAGRFGPVALYARGPGEVRFKDVSFKDLAVRFTPKEETSARFRVQRISDMYYSWAATADDFNRDGVMDVVAGPYLYFGPDFTTYREIYPAFAFNPSKEFTDINCQYTFDFNKDGWPDILSGPPRAAIYLNPKGESRRWDKFEVLPSVQTEVTVYHDLDGSGVPALIYGAEGTLRYAKPDPADPTKPWVGRVISQAGAFMGHGIGVGDINGDGRIDILNANGWWEQPPGGLGDQPWAYHPEAFGRFGHRSTGAGGAVMAVYDVNGDKLNDVVSGLNAHGFGLAWFEQKRDAQGAISFVRHLIMDDYSAQNPGNVTISQLHGSTFADIDGDGIPDFITGKRYWSHLDNYFDPDPYGPPLLYVFRTVRNPKAPGGAEFVPELIHNRSGAGSDVCAKDLNKDGAVDIITSTDRGTFIFWNKTKEASK